MPDTLRHKQHPYPPNFRIFAPPTKISAVVGLSNILDSDLGGRHPAERPHGQVVGAAVVDGKLLCKVIQGIERAARVEAFLILAVAALDLAVVARRVRTDQFMPDIQFGGRFFK